MHRQQVIYVLVFLIIVLLIFLKTKQNINENFNEKSLTIVTAFYPVKTNKHTPEEYYKWIKNFFQAITNYHIVCYCAPEIESKIKSFANNNTTIVARPFNSFKIMSEKQMNIWNNLYMSDPEKHLHSPELYAIWAAKQEFVIETINNYQQTDLYMWCDIGIFRDYVNGCFKNVTKYIKPSKITCLKINNTIGGGVFLGDVNAWRNFSNLYLNSLEKEPMLKDQDIYFKILNDSNAYILEPITNDSRDPWFSLLYYFSD